MSESESWFDFGIYSTVPRSLLYNCIIDRRQSRNIAEEYIVLLTKIVFLLPS